MKYNSKYRNATLAERISEAGGVFDDNLVYQKPAPTTGILSKKDNTINKDFITTKPTNVYVYDPNAQQGSWTESGYVVSRTIPKDTIVRVLSKSEIKTGYASIPVYDVDGGMIKGRQDIDSLMEVIPKQAGFSKTSIYLLIGLLAIAAITYKNKKS